MVRFEDVKNMTTEEYFYGNQMSIDAFNKKYRLGKETIVQAIKRVVDYISSVEKTPELQQYWAERWFDEIYDQYWFMAGSIMQGAGCGKKVSLGNCSTTSLGVNKPEEEWDSLESIFRSTAYTVAKSAAYRQGQGIEFSRIRPSKAKVYNSSNESTGVVHWMKFIDSIGNFVGQCLHGDTLILTDGGYKKIRDIVEASNHVTVISPNGPTKAVAFHKNGVKKLYKLTTQYGDCVSASAEHKIAVSDGKTITEKKLSELKAGDYIVSSVESVYSPKEMIKISKFEYVKHAHNNSNRIAIPEKMPTEINEPLAYVAGYIYGDGCLTGGNIELPLGFAWPGIKEKLESCIFECFGTRLGDYGMNIRPGDGEYEKMTLGYFYKKFMDHCGFNKSRSLTMDFPDVINKSPIEVVIAFFDGLFDADGHNSMIRTNIELCLKNMSFLSSLKRCLARCGIITSLRERKDKPGVGRLSLVGHRSANILSKHSKSVKIVQGNLLAKCDHLKTPYKAMCIGVKYNNLSDVCGSEFMSQSKYLKYIGKDCKEYIQRIRSIEEIGEDETFDITVLDDSHLFLANGILVSNSGRIPAFLISLHCSHPDLIEFINSKIGNRVIQNANISVQNTDGFYKAVENNEDWEMRFEIPELKKGQKIYVEPMSATPDCLYDEKVKKHYYLATHDRPYELITKSVPAKEILELIAKNILVSSEPGIQNITLAQKYSNSDYVYDPNDEYDSRILSSNACVSGDTEVLTVDGYKRIDSLVGQEIGVWNGEKWSLVTPKITGNNKKMVLVKLSDGRKIKCTEQHEFIISNDNGVEFRTWASKLEAGQKLKSFDFSELKTVEQKALYGTELSLEGVIASVEDAGVEENVYCFNEPLAHRGCFNGIILGQCSEQYLSRDSLCILSHLNMARFSTDPKKYKAELEVIGQSINRFLDNVNECELRYKTYATYTQGLSIEKLRRTGAGYTNISGWLFKQNLQYGSSEANAVVAEFTKQYNYELYRNSIKLGHEKGSFGLFNREKYEKSPFIKRMMKFGLEFTAMRNVTCSSIAPVGTTSLMFREMVMSYGIEPPFGMYYWKRTRITGKYEYYFCVPTVVRKLLDEKGIKLPIKSDMVKDTWDGQIGKPIVEIIEKAKKELGIHFKRDVEISYKEKLDLMAETAKWIDSSLSTTYMFPEGTSAKEVYDFILLAHKKEVKSVSGFQDKKMYGIVTSIPFRDLALKLTKEGINIHEGNFVQDELDYISKTLNVSTAKNNDERPHILPCDIFHQKVTKRLDKIRTFDYLALVGLNNSNMPYEIFITENGTLDKKHTKGFIKRRKSGEYALIIDDEVVLENITKNTTDSEDGLTRMVSLSLKSDVPIIKIVGQLEKAEGDMYCFSKAMSRVLKKYIKDGATGEICPQCKKNTVVRMDGCASCSDQQCGWSKCS